ncbi:MAG: GIY-YIG nuclease family protein [Bacteroidota bacterium]
MPGTTYWVYLLTNAKTTVLYVGMTSDLTRRLAEHEAGDDAEAFTARYQTHRLVYIEAFGEVRDAIRREKQIKGWRREKKRALVDAANPAWRDLRPEAER